MGVANSRGKSTLDSGTNTKDTPSSPIFRTSKNAEKPVKGLKVFVGPFVHSLSWKEPCVIRPCGVIGVKDGKILFVDAYENLESLMTTHSFAHNDIIKLSDGQFLMPGLVDTHIHAPQFPNSGLGLDLPLLDWLNEYTFPIEDHFKSKEVAESVYRKVVERTLSNGTTTASYFATIHNEASLILANYVEEYGQRGLIGKVCMDGNDAPDYYIETTEESLTSTVEFVKAILDKKNPLVRPTITPRFALTSTEKLLKGLGDIAKEHDTHIQTHLCESKPEIDRAMKLFPGYKNYTDIYASNGLVTDKSIMAHCVYLTEDEIKVLKESKTGVAHCPSSNICLVSGLCPVHKLRSAGLKVGLGTDVSGGYSSCILDEMRHAIMTSKCLAIEGKDYAPISYREAFFLATLGGAEALALDKEIGNFQVGKSFDALVINLSSEGSPVDLFKKCNEINDLLQKFIMLGDDRNIVKVFVNGELVKSYTEVIPPITYYSI